MSHPTETELFCRRRNRPLEISHYMRAAYFYAANTCCDKAADRCRLKVGAWFRAKSVPTKSEVLSVASLARSFPGILVVPLKFTAAVHYIASQLYISDTFGLCWSVPEVAVDANMASQCVGSALRYSREFALLTDHGFWESLILRTVLYIGGPLRTITEKSLCLSDPSLSLAAGGAIARFIWVVPGGGRPLRRGDKPVVNARSDAHHCYRRISVRIKRWLPR